MLSGNIDSDIELLENRGLYLKDSGKLYLHMIFSSSMEILYACSADGTIKIYKIPSLEKINELRGHKGIVFNCILSQDESFLLSLSSDKTMILWNLVSFSIENVFLNHSKLVYQALFTNSMKFIIFVYQNYEVAICNSENFTLKTVLSNSIKIHKLGITNDDKYLIGADFSQEIWVWDLDQKLIVKNKHFDVDYGIADLKIHQATSNVFILYSNMVLIVWNFKDDIIVTKITDQEAKSDLAEYKLYLSDDCRLYYKILTWKIRKIEIFKIQDQNFQKSFTFLSDSKCIQYAVMSKNEKVCCLSYRHAPMSLIRVRDQKVLGNIKCHTETIEEIKSFNGRFLFSECRLKILLWDLTINQCLVAFQKKSKLKSIKFTKDMKYIVVGFENLNIGVYKLDIQGKHRLVN